MLTNWLIDWKRKASKMLTVQKRNTDKDNTAVTWKLKHNLCHRGGRQMQVSPGEGGGPVADPAMGGPGGPPLTKTLGWSWLREAVCFRPWGKSSVKFLSFGHFFVWKWTKSFQLRPLTPTNVSAPAPCWVSAARLPFRLALTALAMVFTLANPGSTTVADHGERAEHEPIM